MHYLLYSNFNAAARHPYQNLDIKKKQKNCNTITRWNSCPRDWRLSASIEGRHEAPTNITALWYRGVLGDEPQLGLHYAERRQFLEIFPASFLHNFPRFFCWSQAGIFFISWLSERLTPLGIMRVQSRTPVKPFDTIRLCDVRRVSGRPWLVPHDAERCQSLGQE